MDSALDVVAIQSGDDRVFVNDETVVTERMALPWNPPLQKCKRRHISPVGYILHDAMAMFDVTFELNRIAGGSGQDFEVVYDRSTTTDSLAPGHHCYRILSHGGVPSEDILQLEFSCKLDFNKPWTPDNARPPGMWIVEHFKKQDKARRSGTRQEIERDIVEEAVEENRKQTKSNQKELDATTYHFAKEVHRKAMRNQVVSGPGGAKK